MNGGNINMSCGKKGLHSEGMLLITGGNIDIIDSYEGLEARAAEMEEIRERDHRM